MHKPCQSCGAAVHIRARGECDACYSWHARHGWNVLRPPVPMHCRTCARPWREAGKHQGRGLCPHCYYEYKKAKRHD